MSCSKNFLIRFFLYNYSKLSQSNDHSYAEQEVEHKQGGKQLFHREVELIKEQISCTCTFDKPIGISSDDDEVKSESENEPEQGQIRNAVLWFTVAPLQQCNT